MVTTATATASGNGTHATSRADEDIDAIPLGAADEWPGPLDDDAFLGLAGDFVRLVEPETEADPVALLIAFLVAAGNLIGGGPHARVGATRHAGNLFATIVGRTSVGRKGTATDHVLRLLERVDEPWMKEHVASGLSTGEGLISAVRDPTYKRNRETGEMEMVDEGVPDKRLFVLESEFVSPLKVMSREGNTLSPIIRSAWERGNLRTLTRNSPLKATGAHISILGNVTPGELRASLSETDALNGFCNRFLWICVHRSKILPEGGHVDEEAVAVIASRLSQVVAQARNVGTVGRTARGRELWADVYPELSAEVPGLLGAMIGRGAAQVLRLSLVYALLDGWDHVDEPHLRAALAVWDFARASAAYIFGEATGDPMADLILTSLRSAAPGGLTRTEIRDQVGKNARAKRIVAALSVLRSSGLASATTEPTAGRPIERWFATSKSGGKGGKGRKATGSDSPANGSQDVRGGSGSPHPANGGLLHTPFSPENRAAGLSAHSSLTSP